MFESQSLFLCCKLLPLYLFSISLSRDTIFYFLPLLSTSRSVFSSKIRPLGTIGLISLQWWFFMSE